LKECLVPATLFPVPIDPAQVQVHFAGLEEVWLALQTVPGRALTDVLGDYARAAQGDLESRCGFLFFATRFATREVASQESLTLGTDFDRYYQPLDYVISDWRLGTGEVRLNQRFLNTLDLLRLSTVGGGELVDVPLLWLNRDDRQGLLSVIPHKQSLESTVYFRLLISSPFFRGQPGGVVPQIIHPRFSAGLVNAPETGWAAWDALQPETDWDPLLVKGFQLAIAQATAAPIMEAVASQLDRGGVSIGLDGLSESINPGVLLQRATTLRQSAEAWAQRQAEAQGGMHVFFV
jgi:hypothetical protein